MALPIADFLSTYQTPGTRRSYGGAVRAFLDAVYGPQPRVGARSHMAPEDRERYETLAGEYLAGNRDHVDDIIRVLARWTVAPQTAHMRVAAVSEFLTHHGIDLTDRDRKRIRSILPRGGAVTYLARDAGGQRVYRRALTGGEPRAVPVSPGDHLSQRIDGARVALEASGSEIWVYSMNFDTGTQITANGNGAADRNPAIDGTRVVWETNRSGNWDIYTWTEGAGTVSPVTTAAATVTPVQPASRFGTRRYVVGAVPLNPPPGTGRGAGGTIAPARPRTVIGSGTATGTAPPASRFVRWSPLTRWRSGLR